MLLFVVPVASTQGIVLRDFHGFETPEAGQIAAEEAAPQIGETLAAGRSQTGAPLASLGPRCGGGLWSTPLSMGERLYGVLAIASPKLIQGATRDQLVEVAEALTLCLDDERLAAAPQQSLSTNDDDSADGDEVLRLSEQLFAQDIELLKSQERLSQVDKLKNDFIEKMSRELRTPLNGMIEAIISVLAGENETLSESGKLSLRGALDDGTSFLRTLQNILDLWRIRQNHVEPELQEVNVREVVEEAIFSVQDHLAEKPVRIYKRLEDPLPKVRTDLAKISQMIYLVLDNAVKFTESGQIEIFARLDGDTLEWSIEDSGIGICHDDQKLIYDDFFQVDDSSSATYRGSGLGLSLLRELVGLMQGEIWLESEIGQGTAVRVRLPVQVVI